MKFKYGFVVLVLSFVALFSQDKPKSVPMSMATENKILKAENKLNEVTQAEQAINMQFMDLQTKAQALQKQYTEEQAKEKPAREAVDAAQAEAWKESGLDKNVYD